MEKLISVIVPVYNVEKYLEFCIESIISQTYCNLELILIEDGSTDHSSEICREYSLKDSRINVIYQDNNGVSCARNAGLAVARGEYIAFVDSDDAIREDYFEEMIKAFNQSDYDIIQCSKEWFSKSQKISLERKIEKAEMQVISPREAQKRGFIGPDNIIWLTVWGKVFKKESIKNVRFLRGRIYEDAQFMSEIYDCIDKIGYIDKKMYFYRVNPSGIMHTKVTEKNYDIFLLHDEYAKRFSEYNDKELLLLSRKHFYEVVKNLYIQAVKCKANPDVIGQFERKLSELYVEMNSWDDYSIYKEEERLFKSNKRRFATHFIMQDKLERIKRKVCKVIKIIIK